MKINSACRINGDITLPGDKSISHRAAIFAAMADGETAVENFSSAADCASTLACLERLGAGVRRENTKIHVAGAGKNGFRQPAGSLDCGNSGTTVRLLAGVLAGQNFETILTGDESLSRRPMKRVIAPLEAMGAMIEAKDEGLLPLLVAGRNPLKAIEYELPVASAQVKSCVLLAGLNANGKTSVIEKTPTRDHTERMLRWLGADVEETKTGNGKRLTVSGDARLTARDISVPSDISSAAFFLVAAACLPGSELILRNVGLNSSRAAIIDVLQNFGADIEILDRTEKCNEPVGDLLVKGRAEMAPKSRENVIEGDVIANLIDEIPALAVFGTQVAGGLEVRGAAELRVKESDRIAAIVENLRKMGAEVEEFPDGFRVEQSKLKAARVASFGDHRIAMAFAVAALFADGETEIDGAAAAGVSFPEFFDVLRRVAQ